MAIYEERIRKVLPDLSPSFFRVAEFCLDKPDKVAFMTVTELARAIKADPATVVRFAQRAGYEGYPELQDDIRERVKKQLYALGSPAPTSTKPEALMNAALDQAERNIEALRTSLDYEAFQRFAAAIRKARRVHVVAHGPLLGQAEILRAALINVGKAVLVSDADPLNLARAVQQMGAGEVVIVLEIERVSPVVGNLLPLARQRGAATAVLVGQPSFRAAREADWVFHTSNESLIGTSSHAAVAAFISALHQTLLQPQEQEAAKRYEDAYRALALTDETTGKPHLVA